MGEMTAEQQQAEDAMVAHFRNPETIDRLLLEQRGVPAPARVEEPYRPLSELARRTIEAHAATIRHGYVYVEWVRSPLAEMPSPKPTVRGYDESPEAFVERCDIECRRAAQQRAAVEDIAAQARAAVAEFEIDVAAGRVGVGATSEGGVALAVAARLNPSIRHFYVPSDGQHVGVSESFPAPTPWDPAASPDRAHYVAISEGWTALDLAGIRWAPRRPVLYGVHDDGACLCHPPKLPEAPAATPVVEEPSGSATGEIPEPRRRFLARVRRS